MTSGASLLIAQFVALPVEILKPGKLHLHAFDKAGQRGLAQPLPLGAAKADAGKARHPFLKLAIEAVLAMGHEQFQQAHDQRPRQPQKRA